MASAIENGHGLCAIVLVMVLFAAFPPATVHGQAVVTISQPPPSDCPYPCLPPPTTPANYPPPSPPLSPSLPSEVYPPPSTVYPPPGGYFPYYLPPPWYLANAPPPPDPILPYYPWYYNHPLVPSSSSEIRRTRSWVMSLSLLLMIVSLALFGRVAFEVALWSLLSSCDNVVLFFLKSGCYLSRVAMYRDAQEVI
ncbi:hypothetical protein BT93_L4010 [Corymbia citriodora subsp. variegata]|uniref:Uncharacterized protein n=1 Tax=Corymbia citriodora subsp. variegata TaxID=360336 RepID=A0A8T0CUZ8_CORYI|nr:hypothetical protein BT93_L4010 [Corymbia citriodora subsp. variegata]